MAAALNIAQIINGTIYVDGNTTMGRALEIKIPDISAISIEIQGAGMLGKISLPAGFEKMEGDIKWQSIVPEMADRLLNPFAFVPLQVRSNYETWDSTGRSIQKPMSTSMLVNFMKLPTGTNVKAAARQEFTSGFNCVSFKQMVGGEPLVELDFLNNIFKVKGKDLTLEYRENN